MANEAAAVRKARELEGKGVAIMVGSPTVFELYAGVALSRKPDEEKSKIAATITSLPQLSLDFPSALAGGMFYGERIRAGVRIDPEDAMLAGIAKTRAEKVLTRNVKHFSGLEGVSIESY